MTPVVTNPAARPPRWRRVLRWTLRITVAVIVLAIVAWTAADYLAARALDREVEKIRAAGEPTTFEELAKSRPQPPEADDAAPFYGAALLLQNDVEQMQNICTTICGAWLKPPPMTPEEIMQAARQVLDHNSLALAMVDRGAARPACSMNMGMQYGVSAAVAKFSQARNLARLTSLRTQYFARQGQADQAVAAATAAFALHRMFLAQSTMIVHLVDIAALSLWTEDVAVILEHAPPSDAGLVRLDQAMQAAEEGIDLRRVGLGERVYALQVMRNLVSQRRDLQAGPRANSLSSEETWRGMGGPFVRRMAAGVLRKYDSFIASACQDWPALVSQASRTPSPSRSRFSGNLMADMLTAPFDKVVVLSARCVASLRCARTAVLIERYRLLEGHLPENLAELETALHVTVPRDPFTGKDPIYRRMDDGYAVYSLADSQQDFGGAKLNEEEKGNFGVRVRRAERSTGGH